MSNDVLNFKQIIQDNCMTFCNENACHCGLQYTLLYFLQKCEELWGLVWELLVQNILGQFMEAGLETRLHAYSLLH